MSATNLGLDLIIGLLIIVVVQLADIHKYLGRLVEIGEKGIDQKKGK